MARPADAWPSGHWTPPGWEASRRVAVIAGQSGLGAITGDRRWTVVAQAADPRAVLPLVTAGLVDVLLVERALVPDGQLEPFVRHVKQVAPGVLFFLLAPPAAAGPWSWDAGPAAVPGVDGEIPHPWTADGVAAAMTAAPRAQGAAPPARHAPQAGPGGQVLTGDAPGFTPRPSGVAREDRGTVVPRPRVLTQQLVAVVSPKGGVGKTFLATNLAVAVARELEAPVALLDLDLACGDVGIALDLLSGPTIADLLPQLAGLRRDGFRRFLVRHASSGVDVLLAPPRPEQAEEVGVDAVRQILDLVRREYAFGFMDTGPTGTSDVTFECIEQASRIVLVTTVDAAALRQTQVLVEVLKRLSIPLEDRVVLVLNQVPAQPFLSPGRVERFLGLPARGVIPYDRRLAETAGFEGRPAVDAPRSHPLVRALYQVAHELCPVFEEPAARQSVLGRLALRLRAGRTAGVGRR